MLSSSHPASVYLTTRTLQTELEIHKDKKVEARPKPSPTTGVKGMCQSSIRY